MFPLIDGPQTLPSNIVLLLPSFFLLSQTQIKSLIPNLFLLQLFVFFLSQWPWTLEALTLSSLTSPPENSSEFENDRVWTDSSPLSTKPDTSPYSTTPKIPFLSLSFGKTTKFAHILAVSDEDGYVSLFDTRPKCPLTSNFEENTEEEKICYWVSHQNAVFDICWIKEDMQILTASGDQTIKLWDVQEQKCLEVLIGHMGSVKSMCPHPTNADIIVSGSRDGSFRIWDLRCKSTAKSRRREVNICSMGGVNGAHVSSQARRTRRGKAVSMSITSVLCLKDQVSVATAGAVDSVLKFWDTRNLKNSVTQTCPCPQSTEKQSLHGISSLSQDESGLFLSASCMDNRIYLYNTLQLEKGPGKSFSGCRIESFFVKSVINPDVSNIVSGSSDGNAYVWKVDKPLEDHTILKTHDGEVTAVNWCSSKFGKFATCSDDFTVRIWNKNSYVSRTHCASTQCASAVPIRGMAIPSTEC
ncbi:uncharacterized protein LOC108331550 isoform X2 [Vigna angularis]|uniref:uncharacterized protein LOC108331550 isoform X2 n=1 Tax=Phaseolus angularis TaxID=3914 RepID=UPI0008099F10|nr:uncharacterized protein LOC108331550 isoform X2 [Vigna angularis]